MRKLNLILLLMILPILNAKSESKITDKSDKKIHIKKSEKKFIGEMSVNRQFINIYGRPSTKFPAIHVLHCGEKVRAFELDGIHKGKWFYIEKDKHVGFIKENGISDKNNECFKDRFPKFYSLLQLDFNEQFLWSTLLEKIRNESVKLK